MKNCIWFNKREFYLTVETNKMNTTGIENYYGVIPPKDYKGFDYINEIEKYEEFSGYAINVFDYENETLQYIRKSENNEKLQEENE